MNVATFQQLSRAGDVAYDRKNKPHFADDPSHRIEVIQPLVDGIHEDGTLYGTIARDLKAEREALKAKFRL